MSTLHDGTLSPGPIEIFLNTRDATGPNYNPRWLLHNPHLNSFRDFTLTLKKVIVTNSVYPVNSFNNRLYISVDGAATSSVLIPVSSYSGDTLATALSTLLTTGAITTTVTFNSATKLLTFSVSGGTLAFDPIPGSASVDQASAAEQAYEMLGILSFGTDFTSYSSEEPINVAGSSYISIISNMASYNITSAGPLHIMGCVPLPAFGYKQSYEPSDPKPVRFAANGFFELELNIRDEWNNFFILPNNAPLTFQFVLEPLPIQGIVDDECRSYKRPRY